MGIRRTNKRKKRQTKKFVAVAKRLGVKVNRRGKVRKNVAAGFMDEDGVFHPLRASYDYSRKRAGEKTKRKAVKKKATAKRRTNPVIKCRGVSVMKDAKGNPSHLLIFK